MTADNTPPHGAPEHRSAPQKRWWLILLVAGAVITLALTLNMVSGSGVELAKDSPTLSHSTTPSSATSTPSPSRKAPASSPAAAPPLPAPQAPLPPPAGTEVPPSAINNPSISAPVKSAVAGFITKAGQISTGKLTPPSPGAPRPLPPATDFTAVAFGAALGELEAQNQEFSSNGWQQSGTVTVVGKPSTTTRKTAGIAEINVLVCLDSSAVKIVDDTGATVLKAEKPGTRKNLNNYVVQDVAGEWLVVNHTFPNDPHC
ncbi:hypothetical protein [Arthrobacter psychrochitiniphilus]|uniref:hypothetical protein n=1 Tax=Arthrobacter psychrochitiniphilus TaxID=291045 RepID=UPI003F7C690D